ncbi:cytochrome o ubiquinol oxidase subunit 2 [Cupriavidus sp. YR651]|uniref:ubiquinol oxidase subunit II n=1 Tax=Cupriavidus sp. YR651 TaxID=1855315 RepID=UPI00088482D3|nr:ubiquinol oxidase subunit II [Cupriavidus sp. YR651]SDD96211.1 cytochrome o ubiquinol oxidase subunit 2 [Cupriavidus sp. YR651]
MRDICRTYFRYALTALALASLNGCSWVLFNTKGSVGLAERDLIVTCIGLMLFVVIPAIGLTFIFAWKYRAGNLQAKYTPDWAHSTGIEIVVWGVPLIIIAILAGIVLRSTHKLDPYRPLDMGGEPIRVEVIATDWKWVFIYPDFGIATVNELAFPENRQVAFSITSNSTMNTFFIPQLGGQVYAMAGMRTKLHLVANEKGDYRGISGNFSGPGFSDMHFTAHATSEEDFQRWITQVRTSPIALDYNAFLKVAKPSQANSVVHFSRVEPGLFKRVIDQFVDSGKQSLTHAALDIGATTANKE